MFAHKFILILVIFVVTSVCSAKDIIDIEEACTKKKIDESGFRVPGRDGYAWDFYNHPQALRLPKRYGLGKEYSISLWFNLSDSSGKSTLLSSNAWRKFLLTVDAGNGINFVERGRIGLFVEQKLECGRWYNLVITVSSKQVKMYLNGIMIAMRSFAPDVKQLPNIDISVIGAYSINTSGVIDHVFKGLIDKPVLYRKILSGDEVIADYLATTQTIKITPMPQQVTFNNGVTDLFNVNSGLNVTRMTSMLKKDDIGFQWLGEALDGKLTFKDKRSARKLVLWDYKNPKCPIYLKQKIDGKFPQEGYVLSMRENRIDLAAVTPRGLFYGLMTLTEMFNQKKEWPQLSIFDYPTFPFRCGMYVNDCKPPINIKTRNLTDYVKAMARYKVRYFMPRTHDWFDLDSPETAKAIIGLNDLLKKHHMELIPYLQCYGHSKSSLWKNIKTGHTKTIADEEHAVGNSLTVLKHKNVIRTSRTPIIIKAADSSVLTEGQDYTVIDGELRTAWNFPKGHKCKWSWAKPYICEDNEPFKIKWNNVKPATKVFITYDVAADTEGTCPFQKEYHDLLNNSLKRTVALVKPSMINLGMDEIWSPKSSGRCCSHSNLTKGQMVVYEMQRSYEAVKAIAPNVEVMLFNDMLDSYQTPKWKPTGDLSWVKQGKLSRKIIQMPWIYMGNPAIRPFVEITMQWALKNANRVIPACGHSLANILSWTYCSLEYLNIGRVPGVLYTRWASFPKKSDASVGYQAYAQSMWAPDFLMIPGMLEVHWAITELGLTQKSTPEEVASLITALKKEPSAKIKVSELRTFLDKAEYEMELMKHRTHFKQLKILTDSIKQAQKIVDAF